MDRSATLHETVAEVGVLVERVGLGGEVELVDVVARLELGRRVDEGRLEDDLRGGAAEVHDGGGSVVGRRGTDEMKELQLEVSNTTM